MTKENLELLSQKPYMVSWKADGTRFLMLIQEKDKVYMLDRDNAVFKVRCFLTILNHNEQLKKYFHSVLISMCSEVFGV